MARRGSPEASARAQARCRGKLVACFRRAAKEAAGEWLAAERTGRSVLESLATTTSRMGVVEAAAAATTRLAAARATSTSSAVRGTRATAAEAAATSAVSSAKRHDEVAAVASARACVDDLAFFGHIGDNLLAQHAVSVEKALHNMAIVAEQLRDAVAIMAVTAAEAMEILAAAALTPTVACERTLEEPVSLSDLVEWTQDTATLFEEDTFRKRRLMDALRDDCEARAADTANAWMMSSLGADSFVGVTPAHLAEATFKVLEVDRVGD